MLLVFRLCLPCPLFNLIMLYQINYNRGYNTPVCATEYTHADSYDEAWVNGDCMAQYPEQVCDVYPVNTLNDYN